MTHTNRRRAFIPKERSQLLFDFDYGNKLRLFGQARVVLTNWSDGVTRKALHLIVDRVEAVTAPPSLQIQ